MRAADRSHQARSGSPHQPYRGPVLEAADVERALTLGHESRGFEVKGPGRSDDKHLLAKTARAALSMGNLRDGGYIVIGIEDLRQAEMLPGLNDDQVTSWLAYDDVAARIGEYGDPPVRFDVKAVVLANGTKVVVLQVHEFADVPHLCARGYQPPGDRTHVLRKGALYVRSRKTPGTSEAASALEMREVLDLAVEKELRRYVSAIRNAGLLPHAAPSASAPDSDALYEAERAKGWS